jgi:hypothetical protein
VHVQVQVQVQVLRVAEIALLLEVMIAVSARALHRR